MAPRAADPKKIKTIAEVVTAMKRKAQNVSLNLETASFEIKNNKNEVVKKFTPEKGSDAAYVINVTNHQDDLKTSGDYLAEKRHDLAIQSSEYETEFSEKQDSLLTAIETWREASPGSAARANLSIQIGRIQKDLASIENKLRGSQYKYREALPVVASRRLYAPASNDDRVIPYPVYKLNSTQNQAKDRILPLK